MENNSGKEKEEDRREIMDFRNMQRKKAFPEEKQTLGIEDIPSRIFSRVEE